MYKKIFKKGKGVVLKFLIALMIFSIMPSVKSMAVIKDREYSSSSYLKSTSLKKNISLSGVFDRYSWNFNVDSKTKITEAELYLVTEATDILPQEDSSYLTFLLNGTEFYSAKIEKNDGLPNVMRVKLPIDLIKDGFNELTIEGYLRVSSGECTDDYNTSNWLVIKENSKLLLKNSNMLAVDRISEFPYPFSNEGGFESTKVIIPKDYKDYELQNAFKLLGIIGRDLGKAEIIKDLEGIDLSSSNIIYIGRKSEIPKEIENLNIEDFDGKTTGFIGMYKSPLGASGEEKILYILSDDERELNASLSFLSNKDLTVQINTNSTKVDSNMDLLSKSEKPKKTYTFKELGYFQRPVEGLFRRSTSIIYTLSNNKRLGVGDTLNINFRYSENLDFDRSLFTVYINDNPIGSKKLEKDKANGDNLLIHIPIDAVNSPSMEIKFAFDLNLKDVNCEVNSMQQPWGIVLDNSTLQVNEREVNTYYFDSYPAPFVSDWNYNELLFVLPDNLDNNELTSLGNLVSYMGKDVRYNLGSLSVKSSSNLKDEHKDSNIIVYGTPDNNKLIKELNNDMWLKYNNDFTYFTSNEKINIMKEYGKNIASFQFDVSSFNNSKHMLILTSPREDVLRYSLDYLSKDELFYKLRGDGVIVDEGGNIKTFKYKKESIAPNYEKLKSLDTNSTIILAIIGLIGLFAIVSVILYFIKNKKFKKKISDED